MGTDLLAYRFAQAVPQMPAITNLDRVRERVADGLGIGRRAIPAHDLYAGMGTQPGGQGLGLAVGQHVHALIRLDVDQDRGVGVALTQREVVYAQYPWCGGERQR